MRRLGLLLVCCLAIAGCGDDSAGEEGTTVPPAAAEPPPPPSGPVVRICDRRLSAGVTAILRDQGSNLQLTKRVPQGDKRSSSCDLIGHGGTVEVTLDNSPDAVQRYRNRVVESAQFSEAEPHRAPHHVAGVGDPALKASGANWLPWLNQLLSARGKRVLIVDVNAHKLPLRSRRSAGIELSLYVWDRLESA